MAVQQIAPTKSDGESFTRSLIELLDRSAITQVVNDWGLFRDTGRWDQLLSLYAAEAEMSTTWFAGSADEFVRRSIAAAGGGPKAQHFIGASTIALCGDKAIAETRMILMLRTTVAEVPVEVTCHGRFHDCFIREAGAWRIKRRIPVYEKDRLDTLEPGRVLPLDQAALDRFAESYRHLAYVQSLGGATLVPGLPTSGSREEAALELSAVTWLGETGPQ